MAFVICWVERTVEIRLRSALRLGIARYAVKIFAKSESAAST